ncbi:hypothetical protein MGYG_05716 [Nannizzia gypsea CBS 118893]|uniref:Integral membrane protein n=1 Tax=Arthroderma gypseum (strain ATCC MYA-4604 / CBS 118893) TaxID=535722 RepID=E4UXI4_ARTGP|nr:hypothetical protein MGYG_05716 [Nannizzia gypsea CBS 118893]EFR02718.1 hypothetical protein MGYG_05716 [Nannizzia gypsea CBS 118893]
MALRPRSESSTCDPHAFEELSLILLLTFVVLFLITSLVLVYNFPIRRKRAHRNGHAKEGALWTVLGLSLGAQSIAYILDLASLVTSQCSPTSEMTPFTLDIVTGCLGFISGFLLLAATLLPITRLMHECAGGVLSRVTSIGHKTLVILMGADVIVCIALLIWLITDFNVDFTAFARFAVGLYGGLAGIFVIVYHILGVLGSFTAFVNHIIAIKRAPQLRRSGKLRTLAHLLTIAQFAKYATSIIVIWVDSGIESYVLNHIFLLTAIASALYYVPNAALAVANNTEPPRYDQGIPTPVYKTQYAPVNTFPQDETYYSQGNENMTEAYDVPPVPPVGRPQELAGGYTKVPQLSGPPLQPLSSPSSPARRHDHPVELPNQTPQPS